MGLHALLRLYHLWLQVMIVDPLLFVLLSTRFNPSQSHPGTEHPQSDDSQCAFAWQFSPQSSPSWTSGSSREELCLGNRAKTIQRAFYTDPACVLPCGSQPAGCLRGPAPRTSDAYETDRRETRS
jgi:hypothetical protein